MPPVSSILIPLIGAIALILWRLKETRRPLSYRSIIIPPLGMSTGSLMFLYEPTRIPLLWGIVAFVSGWLLFSQPLLYTTKLLKQDDDVFLERSRAFLCVIVGLLLVRWGLRSHISHHLSTLQTASIFYLLAFGMLLRWRLNMWSLYHNLLLETPSREVE